MWKIGITKMNIKGQVSHGRVVAKGKIKLLRAISLITLYTKFPANCTLNDPTDLLDCYQWPKPSVSWTKKNMMFAIRCNR